MAGFSAPPPSLPGTDSIATCYPRPASALALPGGTDSAPGSRKRSSYFSSPIPRGSNWMRDAPLEPAPAAHHRPRLFSRRSQEPGRYRADRNKCDPDSPADALRTAPDLEIEHHRARIGGRPVPNPCDARRLRLVLWRAVSAAASTGVLAFAVAPELTAEFICPSTMELDGAAAEDGATEDGVGAATGFVIIFCSGRINTLLSCAVFSFHHTPPATTTETTSRINTRTIPG